MTDLPSEISGYSLDKNCRNCHLYRGDLSLAELKSCGVCYQGYETYLKHNGYFYTEPKYKYPNWEPAILQGLAIYEIRNE